MGITFVRIMILLNIRIDFTQDTERDEFVRMLLFDEFIKFFYSEIFIIERFLLRSWFF